MIEKDEDEDDDDDKKFIEIYLFDESVLALFPARIPLRTFYCIKP